MDFPSPAGAAPTPATTVPGEISDAELFAQSARTGAPSPTVPGEMSDADLAGQGAQQQPFAGADWAAGEAGEAPQNPVSLGARLWQHTQRMFDNTLAGQATDYLQGGGANLANAQQMARAAAEARSAGSPVGLEAFQNGQVNPFSQIPVEKLEELAGQARSQGQYEQSGQDVANLRQRQAYENMPPAQGVAEHGAAVAGELLGGLASPENLIAPEVSIGGKAATIGGRLLQRAVEGVAGQAPVAAAGDVAVQAAKIAKGDQESFQPLDVALAGVTGGAIGGLLKAGGGAAKDALSAFRSAVAKQRGVAPDAVTEVSPQEAAQAAQDPDLQAILKANGITDQADPRVAQAQQVLEQRRAAEAESAQRPINTDRTQVQAEKDAIATGELDPNAAAAVNARRAPVPEVITAKTGDAGTQAGAELRGKSNALVPIEPQPSRMTPADIARARAANEGGNANTAETPARLTAPEGRAPQTPDDAATQRDAEQAFALAQRQRERAGPDVADTQTGGRPQGQDQQPVFIDDGQPVQIVNRRMAETNGKQHEVATVRAYDPRTGQPDAEAVEYDVPVKQLRKGNYAQQPRQSQDFVERANSPAGDRIGLPEQTFRHEMPGESAAPAEGGAVEAPRALPGREPAPADKAAPAPNDRYAGASPDDPRLRETFEPETRVDAKTGEKFTVSRRELTPEENARLEAQGAGQERPAPVEQAKALGPKFEPEAPPPLPAATGETIPLRDREAGAGDVIKAIDAGTPATPADVAKKLGIREAEAGRLMQEASRREDSPIAPVNRDGQIAWRKVADDSREARVRKLDDYAWENFRLSRADFAHDADFVDAANAKQALWNKARSDADAMGIDHQGKSFDELTDEVGERHAIVAENSFADAEKGAKDWSRSQGDHWDADAFYDRGEPRTLEDLENERQREADAVNPDGRGEGDHAEPAASGSSQEHVQARDGSRGRGDQDGGEGSSARAQDGEAGAVREQAGRGTDAGRDTGAEHGLERTDQGLQRVIPGAERVDQAALDRRALSQRASQEKIAGKVPQKKAGEDGGLFDPGEGKQTDMFPRGSVTLGAFGSPEDITRVIASTVKGAGNLARSFGDLLKDSTVLTPVRNLAELAARGINTAREWVRAYTYNTDANMGAMSRILRNRGATEAADALDKIAGLFRQRTGKEGGFDYHTRIEQRTNSNISQMYRSLRELSKDGTLTAEQNAQLRRILTQRTPIDESTAMGRAAAGIRKLLDREIEYRQAVDKDIGKVDKGYFPRVLDEEMIRKNRDGFVAKATELYRAHGSNDPRAAAEAWADRILTGDMRNGHLPGEVGTNFGVGRGAAKPREFGARADSLLGDFYKKDVPDTLDAYFRSSARATEWQRIKPDFDAARETLARELGKMAPEQRMHIGETVDSITSANLGLYGSSTGSLARGFTNTMQTISFLGLLKRHAFTGAIEPFVAPFRAGITAKSLASTIDSFREAFKYAFDHAKSDSRYERVLAELSGVLNDARSHAIMNANLGVDESAKWVQKLGSKFMHATLMEQLMVGKRVAFTKLAHAFMLDNALKAGENGAAGKRAGFYLKELGIEDPAAFKKWLIDERQGHVPLNELASNDKRANDYLLAINKFVSTVAMRPNAATKPIIASHPFWRVLNTLNAYGQTFASNVVMRNARMLGKAWETGDVHYALPTLAWTLPFLGIAASVEGLRGLTYGKDASQQRQEQSLFDQTMRVLDRSGLTAALSPYLHMVEGVKYRRGIGETVLGGPLGSVADNATKLIHGASSYVGGNDTTSAARERAAGFYDLAIDPALTAAATLAPGPNVAKGVGIGYGEGKLRDAFIDHFGGEKPSRNDSGSAHRGGDTAHRGASNHRR